MCAPQGPDDVKKMGVAAYNAECRKIVMRYSREWEEIVTRMGRWAGLSLVQGGGVAEGYQLSSSSLWSGYLTVKGRQSYIQKEVDRHYSPSMVLCNTEIWLYFEHKQCLQPVSSSFSTKRANFQYFPVIFSIFTHFVSSNILYACFVRMKNLYF